MARLKIPVADVYLPIYHGTSNQVLEKEAGYLRDAALPRGGRTPLSPYGSHGACENRFGQ